MRIPHSHADDALTLSKASIKRASNDFTCKIKIFTSVSTFNQKSSDLLRSYQKTPKIPLQNRFPPKIEKKQKHSNKYPNTTRTLAIFHVSPKMFVFLKKVIQLMWMGWKVFNICNMWLILTPLYKIFKVKFTSCIFGGKGSLNSCVIDDLCSKHCACTSPSPAIAYSFVNGYRRQCALLNALKR